VRSGSTSATSFSASGSAPRCLKPIRALAQMTDFMYSAHKDPERLGAYVGEFHESRVCAGAVHDAGRELYHHGLVAEGQQVEVVEERFGRAVPDFREETYHAYWDAASHAREMLRATLAKIR
jgi:hypothetical protein